MDSGFRRNQGDIPESLERGHYGGGKTRSPDGGVCRREQGASVTLRTVRLIAWNCCEKFAANYVHLRDLDFDIAVVAECAPIQPDAFQVRGLTSSFVQPIPGSSKHLGVFAQDPWSVTPHPRISVAPWLLPMAVTGPFAFTILGFWGVEPRRFGSYPSQLRRVIDEVLPTVEGPVVLAGDFKPDAQGLRENQPFHIDHVFVPHEWSSQLSLTVGGYDQWIASRRSDHVPLVVDVGAPVTVPIGEAAS